MAWISGGVCGWWVGTGHWALSGDPNGGGVAVTRPGQASSSMPPSPNSCPGTPPTFSLTLPDWGPEKMGFALGGRTGVVVRESQVPLTPPPVF